MSFGTEFTKATREVFANKDSGRLGEFLTDDFKWITPLRSFSNRQAFLDWVAGGGSPTSISEPIEFIYENDDIAVCYHGADTVDTRGNASSSRVQCVGRKRDGKFYEWRVARAGDKT